MFKISDLKGTTTLSNNCTMPYFGLGVYLSEAGNEVENAVKWAIDAGYRHIDTAAVYNNEESVGKAVHACGLKRDNIFVTSKVWNADQGYDSTLRAFDESLKKLGFNYLDLYLIHWPVKGKYIQTWKALEKLYTEGRVKAIGVSNFLQHHLEDILQVAQVMPMINQVEFHPRLVQQPLLDFCADNHIQFQSWSPLMRGQVFDIPELKSLATKYKKDIS